MDVVRDVLDRYDEARRAVVAVDRALFDGPEPSFDGPVAGTRALTRALDDLARTTEHGGAIAEVALTAATRMDGS